MEQDSYDASDATKRDYSLEISVAEEKSSHGASEYQRYGHKENKRSRDTQVSRELEVIVVRMVNKPAEKCSLSAGVGDWKSAEARPEPRMVLN